MRRVFIGLENINPGQPDRRQEAAEQDHRIPRNAADVARPRRASPMPATSSAFPADTQGIDPARHRDHQARTAARYSGVLLPDAAAGLGGPQDPAEEGRLDGPRHEQVRPQPSRRASRARCRTPNGRMPTAPPGTLSTRPSTSARSCAARRRDPERPAEADRETIMWFKLMIVHEGVHPLEGGAFRLKYRRDRRQGMPLESPLVFYPRYWGGIAVKACQVLAVLLANRGASSRRSSRRRTVCLHRPRHRAAEGGRIRGARALSRDSGGEAALDRKKLGDSIRRRRRRDGRGGARAGHARRRQVVRAMAAGAGDRRQGRLRPPGLELPLLGHARRRGRADRRGRFRRRSRPLPSLRRADLPLGDARPHRPQAEGARGRRLGRRSSSRR